MTTSHSDNVDYLPIGYYRNTQSSRWFELRANVKHYSSIARKLSNAYEIHHVILGNCETFQMALAVQKELIKNPDNVSVWIVACDMVRWQDGTMARWERKHCIM